MRFSAKYLIVLCISLLPLAAFCQAPYPKWVNDFGGSGDSKPTGMVVDKQNNIYIAGYFSGTVDFDPSSGVKNLSSVGGYDIFVGKYSPTGSLIWAESMGGDALDQVNCMAIDKDGNITLVGQFQSDNLDADPGPGVKTLSSQGGDDIFAIHLNNAGSLLWATSYGGFNTDRGEEVSADSQDNVIITAIFQSAITVGSSSYAPYSGGYDGLIVKYSPAGTVLWSIDLGSSGDSGAFGVRVDSNDHIAVSGVYSSTTNFNPLGSAQNKTPSNSDSPFLAEYSSAGQLLWFNGITGNVVNNQSVVSIDSQNSVYFAAANTSQLVFNGSTTINYNGSSAIVLAKYSSAGAFQFAEATGGTGSGYVYQMVNDQNNNVYIDGYFSGTINFNPAGTPAANVAYHGQRDFFLVKFDSGGKYTYAFGAGSPNCDLTLGIELAVDNNNNVDIAGAFCSTVNFDPTGCTTDNVTAQNGTSDTFIAQYTPNAVTSITNNVITAPTVTNFCGPAAPASIQGSAPAGGSGTYSYQWQSSADSVNFTNIAGAMAQNYTPGILSVNTYFRRAVSSTCATPINSNIIGIKVQPVLANNTITAPAITTFCSTGSPAAISGTTPTGGNGTYSYQWQSSVDNVNFFNISGATSSSYMPPAISATTYYRRLVTSGACTTPLVSNVVTLTVIPELANNTITAPAVTSFCSSGNPAAITGSTPAGGTGTYAYQWQSSADNINFSNIPGAAAINYAPGSITATTYYRREVTSGACSTPLVSNVVTITIVPIPAVPVIAGVTICAENVATLSISSPVSGLTYNWYDTPTKTHLLFTGTTYTTPVLSIGETVYVEAENGTCSSPSLASAQVTVNPLPAAPGFTINPVVICSGSVATLSIASPQAGYTYNWYSSASGGTALASGTDYTTSALTAGTTYYAEAVSPSACNSASRSPISVTVNPIPDLTTVPDSVCPGSTATLTASSTDKNAVISWYAGLSGGSLLSLGPDFTTPVLSSSTTYYVEVVDHVTGCTPAQRTAVTAQILKALPAPVVTVASTTIASVTFQWDAVPGATGYEVSTDNGQNYSPPSSGSTGLTETITGLREGQSVTIVVRATGKLPCELGTSSTAITALAIDPASQLIYVPNAFTPNGDGKNDVVYVHSENIKTLKFYVYDQWGEMIFTSTSLQNGWDGTYKGAKEPVGVYVYYLEAILYNGQQINKKGSITLLR